MAQRPKPKGRRARSAEAQSQFEAGCAAVKGDAGIQDKLTEAAAKVQQLAEEAARPRTPAVAMADRLPVFTDAADGPQPAVLRVAIAPSLLPWEQVPEQEAQEISRLHAVLVAADLYLESASNPEAARTIHAELAAEEPFAATSLRATLERALGREVVARAAELLRGDDRGHYARMGNVETSIAAAVLGATAKRELGLPLAGWVALADAAEADIQLAVHRPNGMPTPRAVLWPLGKAVVSVGGLCRKPLGASARMIGFALVSGVWAYRLRDPAQAAGKLRFLAAQAGLEHATARRGRPPPMAPHAPVNARPPPATSAGPTDSDSDEDAGNGDEDEEVEDADGHDDDDSLDGDHGQDDEDVDEDEDGEDDAHGQLPVFAEDAGGDDADDADASGDAGAGADGGAAGAGAANDGVRRSVLMPRVPRSGSARTRRV